MINAGRGSMRRQNQARRVCDTELLDRRSSRSSHKSAGELTCSSDLHVDGFKGRFRGSWRGSFFPVRLAGLLRRLDGFAAGRNRCRTD